MGWQDIMRELYRAGSPYQIGRIREVDEANVRGRIGKLEKEDRMGMTARSIVESMHYIVMEGSVERMISRTSGTLAWMARRGWVRIIGRSKRQWRSNVYSLTESGRAFAEKVGAT